MLKEKLLRKIWITKKCRVNTELRMCMKDELYQAVNIYYALVLVVLSLCNVFYNSKLDMELLIASIIVLVFTVYVSSKNYKERSINMRNHYVELDYLYSKLLTVSEKDNAKIDDINRIYTNMLMNIENHNFWDFYMGMKSDPEERSRIDNALWLKSKLYDFFNHWVLPVVLFDLPIIFYFMAVYKK